MAIRRGMLVFEGAEMSKFTVNDGIDEGLDDCGEIQEQRPGVVVLLLCHILKNTKVYALRNRPLRL